MESGEWCVKRLIGRVLEGPAAGVAAAEADMGSSADIVAVLYSYSGLLDEV
jgi:hypothetical protein